ncbi:MAG: DnaB-like helicase N-terminal domain-containing protein, partial [Planctomycetaceae bacterium]
MATDSLKLADKLPPQNLDAERGLLGSLLLMNEAADDVADVLRSNQFYSDAHQRIYRAMFDLREKG